MKLISTAFLLFASGIAAGGTEVGRWYDDLPRVALDSTMVMTLDSGRYQLQRAYGDGSTASYELIKIGGFYTVPGDSLGLKFKVGADGLEIYDSEGYIRTARTLKK